MLEFDQRPLISVIVPTFNSEKTIAECLESLIHQSFRSFEILVIDGVSKDNTVSKVQEISRSTDLNIILNIEKDNGIYDAMNKGINRANGRCLYFLGSDDHLYSSDVFMNVSNILRSEEYDFVYGDVIAPDYGGRYDGEFTREKLVSKNVCHQAIFYSERIFKSGARYKLKYPVLADYELNLNCFFNNAIRTKYTPQIIANFSPSGQSKQIVDSAFLADKPSLLFSLKFANSSFGSRIRLVLNEIKRKIGVFL